MGVTSRVIDDIREMISSGELSPGDRLPPEHELADRLGVSRGSLREAVRALSQIKVLDVRRGDGTYVTSLAPSELLSGLAFAVELLQPQGLEEVLEVRRLLLPPAAALAAQRVTREQIAEMHAVVDQLEVATDPDEIAHSIAGSRRWSAMRRATRPSAPSFAPSSSAARTSAGRGSAPIPPSATSRSHTSECCSTPSSGATATWRSRSPPCRSTSAGAGSNTSATPARRGPMTRRLLTSPEMTGPEFAPQRAVRGYQFGPRCGTSAGAGRSGRRRGVGSSSRIGGMRRPIGGPQGPCCR